MSNVTRLSNQYNLIDKKIYITKRAIHKVDGKLQGRFIMEYVWWWPLNRISINKRWPFFFLSPQFVAHHKFFIQENEQCGK